MMLNPNLTLKNSSSNGEDLAISKGRVPKTAIASSRNSDEDSASSSPDNQVVRIPRRKRIQRRGHVAINSAKDLESSPRTLVIRNDFN